MSKKIKKETRGEKKDDQFPLPPEYESKDDIYSREKRESIEDDEEQPGDKKAKKDPMDMELDVPGSELDDEDEMIGEEDEENNYYSLGGDNHEDLEEDQS